MLASCLYGTIAITENWLIDSICNNEIFGVSRFNIFRKNRDFASTGTVRGGVILTVRRKLSAVPINFDCLEIPYIDVVIAKI